MAIVVLAAEVVLNAPDTAWADDPPFRTMGVLHEPKQAPAPEFRLATPDGKAIALAEFRGKVVFLNFWATWCPPCRVEMPSMERLHTEFKDQGLAMVAVDIGIRALPTTVLIDRGGRIVGIALGARGWGSPEGRTLIRSLLERRG